MIDKLARLMRGHLKDLSSDERSIELKKFLMLVASSKDIETPPKRSNRRGNAVECPYGIFPSRSACRKFIMDNNHTAEFLKKYSGFRVTAYTERSAAIIGNTEDHHYIYWAIVHMCRSRKYPDWNFLEFKIKEID